MFPFIRRRMYTSALPLIIVLLGVFLLARLTGDPANLYLPQSATPEQRAEFAPQHGFDQPILDAAVRLLHGRRPPRLRRPRCAPASRRRRWRCGPSPPPCNWPSPQCFWRPSLAVIIGCWAAYRPNSLADRFSSLLSMTAASIPDFWFAIIGVWLFAVLLGVLPTSGVDSGFLSWILPIATLMIRPLGVLTQVVRGAMVSALSAPYVQTGPQQGRQRLPRRHPPRTAQRRGTRADGGGRSGRRPDQRRGRRRDHLRLARHRQADDRRDPATRLRGAAGRGVADRT